MDDDVVVRAHHDRAAFALLYDHYYPQVLRYCVRRLFVRAVAEDVTSEVFLSVARALRDFAGTTETDFRRWLFRIASNAINAHQRQSARHDALRQAAIERRQEQAISSAASPGIE